MNWKFWKNIYRKRIARGVALLDEKVPNWRGHIDLEFFDISNSERCVLGQLNRAGVLGDRYSWGWGGSYLYALAALGLTEDNEHEYGFDIDWETDIDNADVEWAKLNREWRKVLA
jgi:hypothetical protein